MTDRPKQPDALEIALREASRLLTTQPARAAKQALAILKDRPGQPQATLIVGIAQRLRGDPDGAARVLGPLARAQPAWAAANYELGVALGHAGRRKEAVESLRRPVQLKADIGDAWRLIADHLLALGDPAGLDAANIYELNVVGRDPLLAAPATALLENRVTDAERLLREHLIRNPSDVVALRMQGIVAARLQRNAVAEQFLAHCLALAPDYATARYDYAKVLMRLNRTAEALAEVDRLLSHEPRNPAYRTLKAALLTGIGEDAQAGEIHSGMLADFPDNAHAWVRHGHSLRTAGRLDDAIGAYRRSLELAPWLGEAYWALANIRTLRFSAADIEALRRQAMRVDLSEGDRVHLRFALGKALEDEGQYEESFRQYAEGNRLRRASRRHDPAQVAELVRRSKNTFTAPFFQARAGWGAAPPDPIFIIGLPRSGSTLVEQILASHPAVEGTMELPDLPALAWSLRASGKDAPLSSYPELLAQLSAEEFRTLGERYLEQTRVYRKTAARLFTDKLPSNWEHAGLIHLMLPNAKIIDVRRDLMGCGFSCFKQFPAAGQGFTYDLLDIGSYYRHYLDMMAHLDSVLPGRIHRVDYQALVENTDAEVRRLLCYCGLSFEEACLHFPENKRAVRTPVAEQAQSPIFRDSLEQWRHFEPWLRPLREALDSSAGP